MASWALASRSLETWKKCSRKTLLSLQRRRSAAGFGDEGRSLSDNAAPAAPLLRHQALGSLGALGPDSRSGMKAAAPPPIPFPSFTLACGSP